MTEVYEEQVAASPARFAGAGPAEVHVIAGWSVPPGRYRLRQGDPVSIDAQPDYYAKAGTRVGLLRSAARLRRVWRLRMGET